MSLAVPEGRSRYDGRVHNLKQDRLAGVSLISIDGSRSVSLWTRNSELPAGVAAHSTPRSSGCSGPALAMGRGRLRRRIIQLHSRSCEHSKVIAAVRRFLQPPARQSAVVAPFVDCVQIGRRALCRLFSSASEPVSLCTAVTPRCAAAPCVGPCVCCVCAFGRCQQVTDDVTQIGNPNHPIDLRIQSPLAQGRRCGATAIKRPDPARGPGFGSGSRKIWRLRPRCTARAYTCRRGHHRVASRFSSLRGAAGLAATLYFGTYMGEDKACAARSQALKLWVASRKLLP